MDYNAMKYQELKKLCKSKGISGAGTRPELIKQLRAAEIGCKEFLPGMTLCSVCKQRAIVKRTDKYTDEFGRTTIIRQMQCTGKHRHTYALPEAIKK
jgi:hypothetical protein